MGVGNREWGVGNREWGVGNREWGHGAIQFPTSHSLLPTPYMLDYSVTITASTPITVESTTSAASAASAESAPAASARRSILPRTGLVDGQSSSIDLAAVEGRNRRLRRLARIHLDKSEPA